jgi:hypothetical protein
MAGIPYLQMLKDECYHDAWFIQEFLKEDEIETLLSEQT